MNVFVIGGTTVPASERDYQRQRSVLGLVMDQVGRAIVGSGHNLLVCSAHEDSADVPALRGAAEVLRNAQLGPNVECHYPDSPGVASQWKMTLETLACVKGGVKGDHWGGAKGSQ